VKNSRLLKYQRDIKDLILNSKSDEFVEKVADSNFQNQHKQVVLKMLKRNHWVKAIESFGLVFPYLASELGAKPFEELIRRYLLKHPLKGSAPYHSYGTLVLFLKKNSYPLFYSELCKFEWLKLEAISAWSCPALTNRKDILECFRAGHRIMLSRNAFLIRTHFDIEKYLATNFQGAKSFAPANPKTILGKEVFYVLVYLKDGVRCFHRFSSSCEFNFAVSLQKSLSARELKPLRRTFKLSESELQHRIDFFRKEELLVQKPNSTQNSTPK
jgi:hypothetical protein